MPLPQPMLLRIADLLRFAKFSDRRLGNGCGVGDLVARLLLSVAEGRRQDRLSHRACRILRASTGEGG